MTSKDFKKIADIIHYVRRYSKNQKQAVYLIQKSLCELFASDNKRFDKDKFNKACEPF